MMHFFYTNEYLKASGSFNWSTWISSFSFPAAKACLFLRDKTFVGAAAGAASPTSATPS